MEFRTWAGIVTCGEPGATLLKGISEGMIRFRVDPTPPSPPSIIPFA